MPESGPRAVWEVDVEGCFETQMGALVEVESQRGALVEVESQVALAG